MSTKDLFVEVHGEVMSEEDIYEHDAQQAMEFNAIANMIKASMKEGLETEVIHWYGEYRAKGMNIFEACYHAREEWIK